MMHSDNDSIFKIPLPPPITTVLLSSTRKNIAIFLALSMLPLFTIYLYLSSQKPLESNDLVTAPNPKAELIILFIVVIFTSYLTLLFSGYLNIFMLFNKYKRGKASSLYDIKGYLSVNKVFTLVPKHLEGGLYKPYLFIHESQYESISNNFNSNEIISNGFQLFNNHYEYDFNPLVTAQPFSDDLTANLQNGEACRFIGNKRYGLIFINNKIIYLKGKNIIKKSRGF
jgi:hypothetical protein